MSKFKNKYKTFLSIVETKKVYEILYNLIVVLFFQSLATLVGLLFQKLGFHETNAVIIYLLSVLLIARFTKGYFYGIMSTLVIIASYNYFFTEPKLTFSISDPTYAITFLIIFIISITTSALTTKAKQNELMAIERESEVNVMFKLTSRLSDANDIHEIASIAVSSLSDILNCLAACLCFDELGNPMHSFIQQKNKDEQVFRSIVDVTALKNSIINLHSDYDIDEEFYNWPIYGKKFILGVIRIPINSAKMFSMKQNRILHSILESIALAMDRYYSNKEQMDSKKEAQEQYYRSNLLRSISHDLRTPLAAIMGTSEILSNMLKDNEEGYLLVDGIYKEVNWLYDMVQNILSLTRIQEGKLVLAKQEEAIEEVIGAAISIIEKRNHNREIQVTLPDSILMVSMDAKLIIQVLINLLDNAIKYTNKDDEIRIEVLKDDFNKEVIVNVLNDGECIPLNVLPNIFQTFYTTYYKTSDEHRGVGLGLSICETIIKAHNGTIRAYNKEPKGVVFSFALPL